MDRPAGRGFADVDLLSPEERELLVGMHNRADKELAHLTDKFNHAFNMAERIIDAMKLIVRLLDSNVYKRVGQPIPPVDTGIDPTSPFFFAKR